jgi:hypothetical protein
MSNLLVAGYWGDEIRSRDYCSANLSMLVGKLCEVSPLLGNWCALGDSEESSTRLITDFGDEVNQNRRESDGAVIPELGYSFGAWNGNFDASVGLSGGCGVHRVAGLSNRCVLNFPSRNDAPALYESDVVRAVLRLIVEVWDPVWGVATTHALRQTCQRDGFVAGWMTYVSWPTEMEGADVARIGQRGSLIQIHDDLKDVDSVAELTEALSPS